MLLIGMFDSPFVRRVAVSLNLGGRRFEHGERRALLPPMGTVARREAMGRIALAVGAAECARDAIYERIARSPERVHEPWLERRLSQMQASLLALEADAAQALSAGRPFFGGARPDQADITTTCVTTFLHDCFVLPDAARELPDALRQLNARGEAMSEFRASYRKWFAAKTQ